MMALAAVWALAAGPAPVAAQQPLTVILVRHAERAAEPAADPGLSAAGEARAAALAAALAGARVTGIVTTQYLRTRATAAPLAAAGGITPDVVQAGSGGSVAGHAGAVADLIRQRHAGGTVLVVGHSNTVPAIVAALGGPRLDDMCEAEFATLFVLVVRSDGASLVRAQYGAADPPFATDCRRGMAPR